jgi:hypothetical protein
MNCMVPIHHDPRDPVTLVALVGQFAAIMACRNCVGSAWLVHLPGLKGADGGHARVTSRHDHGQS